MALRVCKAPKTMSGEAILVVVSMSLADILANGVSGFHHTRHMEGQIEPRDAAR